MWSGRQKVPRTPSESRGFSWTLSAFHGNTLYLWISEGSERVNLKRIWLSVKL
jgi:hypothetical protein